MKVGGADTDPVPLAVLQHPHLLPQPLALALQLLLPLARALGLVPRPLQLRLQLLQLQVGQGVQAARALQGQGGTVQHCGTRERRGEDRSLCAIAFSESHSVGGQQIISGLRCVCVCVGTWQVSQPRAVLESPAAQHSRLLYRQYIDCTCRRLLLCALLFLCTLCSLPIRSEKTLLQRTASLFHANV